MTDDKKISKFLSFVLRHRPEKIGIIIHEGGWVRVEELLNKMSNHGLSISHNDLDRVVAENDKQRFSYSDNKRSIRANQGHSIEVDLQLKEKTPPVVLYHGTTIDKWKKIKKSGGLSKMNRNHVHLSVDKETARNVGNRHGGKTILLYIDCGAMLLKGYKFFQSENGIWLVDKVPNQFITKD